MTASWLPGDGGPGRKVFTLTPGGRRHLAAQLARWREFTTLTTHLIAEADAR
ncbi:PadR family transcriptional regulator [Xylanimonas allomyrinae]|uniref:PadR family transcriptional regulator n=1 Tax=Xylanimonas allomyrinae TaxID=2509459 RepID=UPI0026A8E710